ncbi:hypothetical protein MHYP_G00233570 [Metynnis hypsauchen]
MKEMAAESSRRFTKNLLKPGSAAEIRQTASSAVRNSTVTVGGVVDVAARKLHIRSEFIGLHISEFHHLPVRIILRGGRLFV